MDPTDAELTAIVDLNGVWAWAGVQGPLLRSVMAELGEPQRVREIPFIPRAVWDAAIARIRIPEALPRAMTPVEGARVESARRVSHLRVGRPVDGPGEVQFTGTPVLPVPFPPAGGASPAGHQARKLKLSAVLDPTLDAEIQPLSSEEATRMYNDYRNAFGDFPTADSDVSMDQLAAVRQVVESGSVPYADFSVFGPFGQRLLRKQTFMSYHLNVATGEWQKREQPGPGDYHTWYRSWRCYRTAMLLVGACEAERLDAYSEFIRSFVTQFGDEAWAFISRADSRMRSEHLERVRRQLRADPQHGYQEHHPWSACFTAAIKESDFWSRELATPATLFLARNRKEAPAAVSDAAGEERDTTGKKRKRGSRPQRRHQGDDLSQKDDNGNFTHNRKGIEVCRGYNSNRCGSATPQGKCKNGRAHQCGLCLGPHQALACPKKKD